VAVVQARAVPKERRSEAGRRRRAPAPRRPPDAPVAPSSAAMSSPFSQAAVAAAARPPKPEVEVAHPPSETDIYRCAGRAPAHARAHGRGLREQRRADPGVAHGAPWRGRRAPGQMQHTLPKTRAPIHTHARTRPPPRPLAPPPLAPHNNPRPQQRTTPRAARTFSPSEIAFWDFKSRPKAGEAPAGAPMAGGEPLGRRPSAGGSLFSRLTSFFGAGAEK
jgi:hypothetical protein